jgi:hypothetical protein
LAGAKRRAVPDPLPVNEHVNAPDEPHEHSVRPGAEIPPADESDLDVTWLDKAITAIERGVASLFGGTSKGTSTSAKRRP